MERPNRKRMLKLGGVMILVSILLFSASIYLIDANTVSHNNVSIPAGSSFSMLKGHVSAGDDIDYSVTSNLNGLNVTTYLSYDTGVTTTHVTSSNVSRVTSVVVAPASGNLSLVIVNNGPSAINVDISIGSVDYVTLMTTVFGFVLLPSGIALIGIYIYARRVEKRKEKLLRGFE